MTTISRREPPTTRHGDPPISRQHTGLGQTMKITKLALIATATVAATIALPATAQADDGTEGHFLSPSGNIWCNVWTGDDGKSSAVCETQSRSYPLPRQDCQQGAPEAWFRLDQGNPPYIPTGCHTDTNFVAGLPTLPYGHTRSASVITCDSEPTSMTCTDSSTGHFFRVSRESYQLG